MRSRAAIATRAAFEATIVWNVTQFNRKVSTIWASIRGAVTRNSGSRANAISPSLIAQTSPENLSFER